LHAKGWTREAAIQYLVDNTAMDEQLCEDQVKKIFLFLKECLEVNLNMIPISITFHE
jgi:hypothetical protein